MKFNGDACPLCEDRSTHLFHENKDRKFVRCPCCKLTFVPSSWHLSADAQLDRYRSHRNSPDDPAYRSFLSPMISHLAPKLVPGSDGLDYGAGPGPTLSVMFEEKGFRMNIYDPFFAPDRQVLLRSYAFITCTETAEHFAYPYLEFEAWDKMLRPGGWIGIMTRLLDDDSGFPSWWYHRDQTHVAFYRIETMLWVAARYCWKLELPAPDIILFQKSVDT